MLIDIQEFIPTIVVDLRYATPDNFMGQILYDSQRCLLHKDAALCLRRVQNELFTLGMGLKVWDGFRPIAAQWKMWEAVPDERYVSDPRKGGRHTRGTAVDVTLVDAKGRELVMPTGFDDFSERAHRDNPNSEAEAIHNRELLRAVMEKHGFTGIETEWWHYDLAGWKNYPLIEC